MMIPWDEVIESHYLETVDGLFFAVKGLVHPPDRCVAYVRYAPDPAGTRVRDGRRYRRLYHFAEQEALLRDAAGAYMAYDPVWQVTLQSVPHERVARVHDPRERVRELRDQGAHDAAEADTLAFLGLLRAEAGIPWDTLGVSGSLLIGLHTVASDLDVSVYGTAACRDAHNALARLLDAGDDVRRLAGSGLDALYRERSADTRMSYADFAETERRKVIQGEFRGRPYFIRFLQAPGESAERYGSRRYTPLGRARIRAEVVDASQAIFTPCRYALADAAPLSGVPADNLTEVVSFRGRFCEQAQAGDRIEACGTVERVETRDGRAWQRLLLGSDREDTMVPWR